MPNLQGMSRVGRDGEERSYMALMVGGSGAKFDDIEENGRQDAKNGA